VRQKGFILIPVVITIVLIGVVGYFAFNKYFRVDILPNGNFFIINKNNPPTSSLFTTQPDSTQLLLRQFKENYADEKA
jgi:hypothetical protein